MRSLRNATVALATAGALALSVTPAMAQESSEPELSSFSLSSTVAEDLGATEEQRNLFGSSKNLEETSDFGKLWYGYTIAATVAAVAGGVALAYPQIQDVAAQNGIQLPDLPL